MYDDTRKSLCGVIVEKPPKARMAGIADFAAHNEVLTTWAWEVTPSNRRTSSRFNVRLFLAADVQGFEYDAAVRAGLLNLFGQSYQLLRTMEIWFRASDNNEAFEPCIPAAIWWYAQKYGIALQYSDRITDSEGQALFIRMNLSVEEYHCAIKYGLAPLTLAFQKLRGTWSDGELQCLFRYTSRPHLVLNGELLEDKRYMGIPFETHKYALTRAILAERTLNFLGLQADDQHGGDIEGRSFFSYTWVEPDIIQVQTKIEIEIGCLFDRTVRHGTTETFLVALFPYLNWEYTGQLAAWRQRLQQYAQKATILMAVTNDLTYAEGEYPLQIFKAMGETHGIQTLLIPCNTMELHAEFIEKLRRAGNFATSLGEQPDG
jgi:hypothetical protein